MILDKRSKIIYQFNFQLISTKILALFGLFLIEAIICHIDGVCSK